MSASPTKPCIACGRNTAAGTRLFSDRVTTLDPNGRPRYLCGDCNERAISHHGRRLTEADMVQIAARGAGMGMA